MDYRTIFPVCFLSVLCISPSLQCPMSYHNSHHISYNDSTLLNVETVRSAIECSVNCATQNCVSFSFHTQTKACTMYGNGSHNETGMTNYKTSTMTRFDHLVDCGDLCCTNCSGVYRITPVPGTSFDVFCDTDTIGGPWTVIQRRFDGSVDFYRNWEDYKWGFGTLDGEHWLGLEYIHSLLSLGQILHIHLEGWNGTTGYATYSNFSIGNESLNYQLTIGGFIGDVEEKFINHNEQYFSTYDRDNDSNRQRTCTDFGKGGWWYNTCYNVNLNGLYIADTGIDERNSMNWNYFYPGRRQPPLRTSSMMTKRKEV